MRALTIVVSITLAVLVANCRPKNVKPEESRFVGIYKAKVVKEAEVVVFRLGAATNIIPGYSNFRIEFIEGTGKKTVKLTEYTGDVFEGEWRFTENDMLLTFHNLNPSPYDRTLDYKVSIDADRQLILSNTRNNSKTGNTINQYTLIPE